MPCAQHQRRFLLTIYVALLPEGTCRSAGRVSNATRYGLRLCRRKQERNQFGRPARRKRVNDWICKRQVQPLLDSSRSYALKKMRKNHIVETRQQEHIFNERNIMLEARCDFIVRFVSQVFGRQSIRVQASTFMSFYYAIQCLNNYFNVIACLQI